MVRERHSNTVPRCAAGIQGRGKGRDDLKGGTGLAVYVAGHGLGKAGLFSPRPPQRALISPVCWSMRTKRSGLKDEVLPFTDDLIPVL